MGATDRTPIRVRDIPNDLVGENARNALSTPYTSETREEEQDIDVYKPEHEVQEEVHEPEAKVEEESPPA